MSENNEKKKCNPNGGRGRTGPFGLAALQTVRPGSFGPPVATAPCRDLAIDQPRSPCVLEGMDSGEFRRRPSPDRFYRVRRRGPSYRHAPACGWHLGELVFFFFVSFGVVVFLSLSPRYLHTIITVLFTSRSHWPSYELQYRVGRPSDRFLSSGLRRSSSSSSSSKNATIFRYTVNNIYYRFGLV